MIVDAMWLIRLMTIPDLHDRDAMWLIQLMTIPDLHDSGCHVVDTVDADTRSA